MGLVDPFDPRTIDFDVVFRLYAGSYADIECVVDEADYYHFQRWLWAPQVNKGKIYFRRALTIRQNGVRWSGSEYLHVAILTRKEGSPPTRYRVIADHRNGNSLDNRRENLRWVTRTQNNRNRFGRDAQHERRC